MIVCLGWGSLIWNPNGLLVNGDWQTDGPGLPVEFARQSNDGRITLVIEPNAKPLPVLWMRLAVGSVDAARQNVADREDVCLSRNPSSIGHWSADGMSRHPESVEIGAWARTRGADVVVWTALEPKFDGKPVTPTSEEVVTYLRGLKGCTRIKAEQYVRNAPLQIMTAYREAIELQLGWTGRTSE